MLPHDTSMTNAAAQIKLDALAALRCPIAACAHLTTCASAALDFGTVTPLTRATLEAAHSLLCDLRLEYGLEEWESADWSNATVQTVGLLGEDYYAQETRARAIRDASALLVEVA